MTSRHLSAIRRRIYDVDFGQHGWSTASEVRALAEACRLEDGMVVVDVAAGSGGFLAQFCGQRAKVMGIGLDLDIERRLQDVRQVGRMSPIWCAGDAHAMPFKASSFHVVTCVDAAPVIGTPEHLLAELRRVVRQDGCVLVVDPAVITGPVPVSVLRIRSGPDNYTFTPATSYPKVFAAAGLSLSEFIDLTPSMEQLCGRWLKELVDTLDYAESDLGDIEHQIEFCETLLGAIRSGGLGRHAYVARPVPSHP